MPAWTFYPVFFATVVSIFGLSRIVIKQHTASAPKTLSELAAAEDALLQRFRNILIVCGGLFAITLFGFIVPRVDHALAVTIFGVLMIGGELLVAVVPARGATFLLHLWLAQIMATGMLGLAILFAVSFIGVFALLATILMIGMLACALLTILDKKHYIVYELAFIFLSHFSIVVAALGLK